ncbi:GDPD-domain-containing protein [Myriangium duriaei CBS 260.36]|uniref:GDPD-domain-containing protein n=1 Tax=Myriangium duriaei CBS 260.36 TaxID=1168546 RepID=A0A9P4MDG7_9PEZI|nr:GDPD-domain-containing protein [Myriangium duriaei CBS 260.36]
MHLSVESNHLDSDAAGSTNGWTPLFEASTSGNSEIVNELFKSGAKVNVLDKEGWTAREHAVFKGHLKLAEAIDSVKDLDADGGPANPASRQATKPAASVLNDDEKVLILTLGVTQKNRDILPFHFSPPQVENGNSQDASSNYVIGITCEGANEPEQIVADSSLADAINNPFLFHVSRSSNLRVCFKIYSTCNTRTKTGELIGGGVAVLDADQHRFGPQRESLVREHMVPLLDNKTMCSMGVATISTLVVHPYNGPVPPRLESARPGAGKVELVGHRGLGQNTADRSYLQLGENTIESFVSACKLGASMVEFDVQVTRDLVPVIYHDLSLSESGTDVPIHDLTLDQFLHASDIQSPRGRPPSWLGAVVNGTKPESRTLERRSVSLTRSHERGASEVQDRMMHTVDFQNKGFKPNSRGTFVHDSFVTLEDLLLDLPEDVGFNAEIKYPRLHEALDAGLAPIALTLNTFIDASLSRIFQFGGRRRIILSSFTPEVCIALALKQQTYPVMFITNAGKPPMTDMEKRAESVEIAVKFAKRWKLAGVVFACEAFLLCPRLVRYVKNHGLVCASYGLLNNVPENAELQARAGIDIIMADRVGIIARALESIDQEHLTTTG